jgi:hypothetical protein
MTKGSVGVGDVGTLADAIRRYREKPREMVIEQFGTTPDRWQDKVLEDLASDARVEKIAMSACAGPGKTCLMAWSVWWFLLCQGDHERNLRGAALSVTRDNLRDNLWSEMHTWYNKSPLLQALFTINAKAAFSNDHPNTWFISVTRAVYPDRGG